MALGVVGRWSITLTPDDVVGVTIGFFLKVADPPAQNRFTGRLTNEDGTMTGAELRKGRFIPGPNDTNTFFMCFEVDLAGLVFYVSGIAFPLPADPTNKLKFNGTYTRMASAGVTAALLAEPGETGTGGGQQTAGA